MTNHDAPLDLNSFRAKREQRKARSKAREPLPGYAVNCGRVIPPPLNPDLPDMVNKVKDCYLALIDWIAGFQNEIANLVDVGKLDCEEQRSLLEHYRDLQDAVDAATADARRGETGSCSIDDAGDETWNDRTVHRFADHAKYVYAVGARDIAALQYRLAELAHTGRLDSEAHKHLQWDHCLRMWEVLYYGTTSAVRDARTWDGAWDWYDNVYSDGRQVMAQVRMKNWLELERNWPYNEGMCGDGPIQEYPRGSLCQIYPVIAPGPVDDPIYHPSLEIDLEHLIAQLSPPPSNDSARECQ